MLGRKVYAEKTNLKNWVIRSDLQNIEQMSKIVEIGRKHVEKTEKVQLN
jgi:hypothetical protein